MSSVQTRMHRLLKISACQLASHTSAVLHHDIQASVLGTTPKGKPPSYACVRAWCALLGQLHGLPDRSSNASGTASKRPAALSAVLPAEQPGMGS